MEVKARDWTNLLAFFLASNLLFRFHFSTSLSPDAGSVRSRNDAIVHFNLTSRLSNVGMINAWKFIVSLITIWCVKLERKVCKFIGQPKQIKFPQLNFLRKLL